ncbi:MAG: hypothetical protein ACMXYD_02895 [Candidatus Woesearchaeota archaeon]
MTKQSSHTKKDSSEKQEEEQTTPSQQELQEQEVRELLSRIQAAESRGAEDQALIQDLARRGVSTQSINRAWQQHIQDFPEHEHETTLQELLPEQESLEERLAGVQATKQSSALYDVQNKLEEGLYVTKDELYEAFSTTQQQARQAGGITDNQYQAINTIQERMQQVGYANKVAEDLKNLGKLRIGDSYLRNE